MFLSGYWAGHHAAKSFNVLSFTLQVSEVKFHRAWNKHSSSTSALIVSDTQLSLPPVPHSWSTAGPGEAGQDILRLRQQQFSQEPVKASTGIAVGHDLIQDDTGQGWKMKAHRLS